MKIEILGSDGVTRQTKKLKPHVAREKAEELLERLAAADWTGCSYYLLDDEDNELLAFEL